MLQAPFPYFGGKTQVADFVWQCLGDCRHYIEPFFGSGAVLLSRPNYQPGTHVETVNDKDGYISNVWRALQADPDAVAKVCDWPVNHADLSAKRKYLIGHGGTLLERLIADPEYYDTKLAGYWIWAASCWIGSGLMRPGSIPHLGDAGQGVHNINKIPHLTDAGEGVHKISQIPHLTDAGNGVHKISQIPHLAHAGKGVHKISQRPHLAHAGMGVQEPYNTNLYSWFRELSERLRYVRVVCGDWTRVCGGNWQDNIGTVGMFFDPPYSAEAGRNESLYHCEDLSVAHAVREWALERGKLESYRIVLAGYYEEHESLLSHGWRVKKWSAQGGYANAGKGQGMKNRHKEALFISPHCVEILDESENLFAGLENND